MHKIWNRFGRNKRIIGFFMIFYSILVSIRGLDNQFRNYEEFIGHVLDILTPLAIGIFNVLKPDFIPNNFKKMTSRTATKKRNRLKISNL